MDLGKVKESLPEGLTVPKSTSARPWPVSWPPNQACSRVDACDSHGISMGQPDWVTIIWTVLVYALE